MCDKSFSMKAKTQHKKTTKLQVKRPATLKDLMRIHRIKNGLLKEAKKIAAQDLRPAQA